MTVREGRQTSARMEAKEEQGDSSGTKDKLAHTSPLHPTTKERNHGHGDMSDPLQTTKDKLAHTPSLHLTRKERNEDIDMSDSLQATTDKECPSTSIHITSLQHIHFSSDHFSPALVQPMCLPLNKQIRTAFRRDVPSSSSTISLFTKHKLCLSWSPMSPLCYTVLLRKIGIEKRNRTIETG